MQDPRTYDASMDVNAQASERRGDVAESQKAESSFEAENQAAMIVDAVQSGKRAFINPVGKTFSFLVRSGQPTACYAGTKNPVVPGVPGPMEVTRVGDIRAEFTGGILVVDPETEEGAVILEWAEAHPEICRDAMEPETETWAALKTSQLNLADKEPSLPTNINVDRILNGDFSGFSEHESATQRARRILAASA